MFTETLSVASSKFPRKEEQPYSAAALGFTKNIVELYIK